MNITIRQATIDDLKTVQQLNLELFVKEQEEYDATYSLEWTFGEVGTKYYTSRIEDDRGFVLLAEADGEAVGYLCGWLSQAPPYRTIALEGELENMMLQPGYRSKGVGSQMVEQFLQWCKEKKADKVKVEASAPNTEGIHFYEKNGFVPYSVILEQDL